ncbi:MAG: histidine kinase [Clostridia bacterium]|nr:histidine kinase [Clostridia bacterium]
MIETTRVIGFSVIGAMLVTMAFGITFSVLTPATDRWSKHYFVTLFSLLFVCSLSCFFALLFWDNPRMAVAERIVYFFESLFLSSLVVLPTVFLLHCRGKQLKESRLFKVIAVLLGVYMIVLIAAQFTDVFYFVTADNRYLRGPLYAWALVPLLAIMLLNIVYAVRWHKEYSGRYFAALLVYLLPMTAVLCIDMFVEAEVFVILCMALFALLMFGIILSENLEQYARQQREIANQRADIMVLQMRPHFIYNTMMSIYYLCDQDPQKAKQVTMDFTTYLRKNFTAIVDENTIPFAEELEHTRAYLAVEQAQFEDTLFVDFDTPHTAFRMPPLTLQPIVENAVKHGMRASNAPIHVSIRTRKADAASEIIVEDDGPGFQPADNNQPHIALKNIRERLAWMCKGELVIAQRPGGGTVVRVVIPQAHRCEE